MQVGTTYHKVGATVTPMKYSLLTLLAASVPPPQCGITIIPQIRPEIQWVQQELVPMSQRLPCGKLGPSLKGQLLY
jgi:hypothetical protein